MTTLTVETQAATAHVPVMVQEAVLALTAVPGGSYIDCNLGDGGHSRAILKSVHGARVLGIDLDQEALARASERLSRWAHQISVHHGNFADLVKIAQEHHHGPSRGVLFDLGVSSAQLDEPDRGFSFRHDARLDMRFNRDVGLTAYDIVNRWPLSRLEEIIRELGDEPRARRVAKAIVRHRRIDTTIELAKVVSGALNWPARSRHHPATRTFQALRMAVNGEVDNLKRGLNRAAEVLQQGGRLVVISYHSIEDRVVKQFMRGASASCTCPPRMPECRCDQTPTFTLVSSGVIRPSMSEIRNNPRARSARMRVAERI
jgi:16S rRNA (cytosine1402-N4)-methyltransferase